MSSSFEKFLSVSNSFLPTAGQQPSASSSTTLPSVLHIIVGNQASDLDSIVSALSYAFLKHQTHTDSSLEQYVGVLPIKKTELRLRNEVVYLFSKLGIQVEDLLFLDDLVDFGILSNSFVTLVDHNLPTGRLAQLSHRVTGILDHHEDLHGQYPLLTEKVIEMVGSCCTLVAEKYLEVEEQRHLLEQNYALTYLLLATILIDSINLNPAMGKTTPKDTKVAEQLLQLLNKTPPLSSQHPPINPSDLYNEVYKAKNDVSFLTSKELLSRDYKEWEVNAIKYGISSIPISLKAWITHKDIKPSCRTFCEENQLDLFVVLTSFTDPISNGNFSRELLVFEKKRFLGKKISNELKKEKELLNLMNYFEVNHQQEDPEGLISTEVDLETEEGVEGIWLFVQQNIKSSRKQVQPLIHSLLQNISKV